MSAVVITIDDVRHVALLARLELDDRELEQFTHQLNDILGYMDQLKELDTSDTEPMAHVLPLTNVWREDRAVRRLDREQALQNAPEAENGFFRVPRVI